VTGGRRLLHRGADIAFDRTLSVARPHRQWHRSLTWPDGGQTPFAQSKGTVLEGGFRAPAVIRWPGKVPAGKVENGIMSGLDWFPTFVAAAGNPNIAAELKQGTIHSSAWLARQRNKIWRATILRLVQIRILALRICPAASREAGDDRGRVSPNAKGREFQPRRREGENHGSPGVRRQVAIPSI